MSRNKYPEETYELIVEVSTKLFIQKGYDNTSLKDIIDNLGGLTKGAIYHHFKSKEDILIAVVNNLCSNNGSSMMKIRNEKNLSGKQKLEKMFLVSLNNPKQEKLFSFVPNLLDNPTFLAYYLKFLFKETIPVYIVPVIKEGVEDGSIHTDYPEELASILMFITDIWLNPLIVKMSNDEIIRKANLANDILKPFGIKIFNEQLFDRLSTYNNILIK